MQTHTVQTRSGELAYLDEGQGRVALFLHGVATNSSLWGNVITALRDERRCVAIDLPLHGGSPPREDYSLTALAEAIEDFCAALDLTGIDLVSNDTGGAIAQAFATRHPERLRTFTLTNCDTHDNMPPENFKPTVEMAQRGELAPMLASDEGIEAARAAFSDAYEHAETLTDEKVRTYIDPVRRTPERAREFERVLTSLLATDLMAIEPDLRKLDVPTLVVWGTGCKFFELKYAYWLRDTIPSVTEVIEVEGARLFFPDERPDDLVPHLRALWAAH